MGISQQTSFLQSSGLVHIQHEATSETIKIANNGIEFLLIFAFVAFVGWEKHLATEGR
jgi:hypothetical protein